MRETGRLRRHGSFANAASALALFVALGGGTAIAVSGGGDGAKRAFQSGDVVRGVIGARDNVGTSLESITAFASLPPGARLPGDPSSDSITVQGAATTRKTTATGP